MAETINETIQRYLEDAIAAEHNFETTNRTIAAEADMPEAKQLFEAHADETHRQHQRLEARLAALGGKPSGIKGFFAHLFGNSPKLAQLGHDKAERTTQDLIIAYAAENSEVAMYEALAVAAAAAGDAETESLAREIQAEERRMAEAVWALLPISARSSFQKVVTEHAAQQAA